MLIKLKLFSLLEVIFYTIFIKPSSALETETAGNKLIQNRTSSKFTSTSKKWHK